MIKDVVIVGLGGVGAVYASKLPMAKILLDKNRLLKYQKNPTIINNEEYRFNYITDCPKSPDLIIVTTKFYNLPDVIKQIRVSKTTIIMSLINGISAGNILAENFPNAIVVPAYLICDSIMRKNRTIFHNDVNKIVIEHNSELENFFAQNNINFEVSDDIKTDQWQKFMLNIIANQLSAVTRMTFGEMNSLPYIDKLLQNILKEVVAIAKKEGVEKAEIIAQNAIDTFHNMAPYGKTSMLQDIENSKRTEIDAFAGYIIDLGKKYDIPTPYNNIFNYLLNVQ